MSNTVIWIQPDCLSVTNPALVAYIDTPAIFIWDETWLNQYPLSLKRVTFIYECLLELPCVIQKGDSASLLQAFAQEHGATRIATTETPHARSADIISDLNQANYPVEIHTINPFLTYEGKLDLKRFSRYWRVVQKHL